MAKQLFANNAGSMLAVSIDDNDLSLQVAGGFGALFPSPTGGDWFLATLMDADGNREIVKCTARSTDVLTIVRAQEGSTAQAWTGNAARVECRVTKGTLNEFIQVGGGAMAGELRFSEVYEGDDLAIFHDGTHGYIDLNTGALIFRDNNADTVLTVLDARVDVHPGESGAPGLTFSSAFTGFYSNGSTVISVCLNATAAPGAPVLTFSTGAIPLRMCNNGTAADNSRVSFFTPLMAVERGYIGFPTNASDLMTIRSIAGGLDIRDSTNVPRITLTGSALSFSGDLSASSVITSGTYTPTYTGLLNVTDIDGEGVAMYTRIGNVVTVKGQVIVDPTVINTNTQFRVSLPIASNLANPEDLLGLLDATYSSVGRAAGSVVGSTSADAATANFTSGNTSGHTVTFEFSYLVN